MGVTRQIPHFEANIIEGVCDVIGDTSGGLTGSDIGHVLAKLRIKDTDPTMTKRHRLYNALVARQNQDQAGNCVVALICEVMSPVRYRNDPQLFTARQQDLDEVLVHVGLRVNDEGQVAKRKDGRATTLGAAAERVGALRTELRRRGTHDSVLLYCTDEILARNNFHAVLEASKSVLDRLRMMSGLTTDGSELVDSSLLPKSNAMIRINGLTTPSEQSAQAGFAALVKGIVGLYRNPTAHDPKIHRPIADAELYEAFSTLSMIHRRLDEAKLHR